MATVEVANSCFGLTPGDARGKHNYKGRLEESRSRQDSRVIHPWPLGHGAGRYNIYLETKALIGYLVK
jgi:hypothetical protein